MSACIIGATSGIARALAIVLGQQGHDLVLTVRDREEGDRLAADLRLRTSRRVEVVPLDLADFSAHADVVATINQVLGAPCDVVVMCAGIMHTNDLARADAAALQQNFAINLAAPAIFLERIADAMQAANVRGVIAGISSVAGDRGRQKNYLYGAAKAGFTTYLSGLRNRLAASGIHVLTIKPGFVATAMTHGLIDPKSPLLAQPEPVARAIAKAIHKRTNCLYVPFKWWVIMTVICAIPERIFKRLDL